jgi:glycine cleavage system aminomethyltransferase T
MSGTASRSLSPTPLHASTAGLCAANGWIEEGGFTVPALYTSQREEADALVSRAALCDLSARQCWSVQGADAAAFLSTATLADAQHLEAGQTARTAWCDDHGFLRGTGTIVRLGKAEFELWTSVRDFAWFADGARGFDIALVNATGARAVIGVRGPLAANLLAASGIVGDRPPAHLAVMRDPSGDGIDLSMQSADGAVVWDRLWRAGAALGVAAVGADALEQRRLEAAIAKPGVDWTPAQFARADADLRTPADLGFAVDPARRFNGADNLRAMKGPRPQVFAQFSSDDALAPGPVMLRGVLAGRLTSHAWSHARAVTFALGWLDPDAVKVGTKVSVPGTAGPVRAEIVRQVF